MWHCTPRTRSTPFSDPRRPFLIVSPNRSDDVGSPTMQASMRLAAAAKHVDDGDGAVARRRLPRRTSAAPRSSRAAPDRRRRTARRRSPSRRPTSSCRRRRGRTGSRRARPRVNGSQRPLLDRARRHDVHVAGEADERRLRRHAAPTDSRTPPRSIRSQSKPAAARRAAINPGCRHRRA